MGATTQWCNVSAWARLVSGHRWGLYRWLVAAGSTAASVAVVEAWLGSVGSVVGIAVGLGCLWRLPGPRVGAGWNDRGVIARGWIVRRWIRWEEIDMLRLGIVSGWMLRGGFPGVALVCAGRQVPLQRWLGRPSARSRALAPLVDAARDRGITVLLEPEYQYAFPGIEVDQVGRVRWVDGAPVATTAAAKTTRGSASAILGVNIVLCLGAIGAVLVGVAQDDGDTIAVGSILALGFGVGFIELVPRWRWAWAQG